MAVDFTAYTLESAPAEAKPLLQGVTHSFGFLPNLFSYMAEAPVTIDAYLHLNALIAKSSLTPAQAQVALLSVSIENDCGFCTVAHRAIGKKSGVHPQTLDALAHQGEIADPQDRALSQFTRTLVKKRGWLEEGELDAFLAAGFSKQNVFEVILVVTIKTLSNYSNHLTKPEPNPELVAML